MPLSRSLPSSACAGTFFSASASLALRCASTLATWSSARWNRYAFASSRLPCSPRSHPVEINAAHTARGISVASLRAGTNCERTIECRLRYGLWKSRPLWPALSRRSMEPPPTRCQGRHGTTKMCVSCSLGLRLRLRLMFCGQRTKMRTPGEPWRHRIFAGRRITTRKTRSPKSATDPVGP